MQLHPCTHWKLAQPAASWVESVDLAPRPANAWGTDTRIAGTSHCIPSSPSLPVDTPAPRRWPPDQQLQETLQEASRRADHVASELRESIIEKPVARGTTAPATGSCWGTTCTI